MRFNNKRIALLGFGLENQALLVYLQKQGAKVTVCDKNTNLQRVPGVEFFLGDNYLDNLARFDIIFRSPGVPYLTPELQDAGRKSVEILSQTKLFFEESKAKIIGVTGTKGKGTVATLLSEVLKVAKERGEIKGEVFLVGNIGLPAISILDKTTATDYVVFELSSFQLQDLDRSPHVAVITNITEDHLDHHKTKDEYIESKKNIVQYQKQSDFAIINFDSERARSLASGARARVYYFSHQIIEQGIYIEEHKPEGEHKTIANLVVKGLGEKDGPLLSSQDVFLLGVFNLENVSAAALAALALGVSKESIKTATANFRGLPHRLEYVTEINQVKFYNDSAATTPEATIAAIKSFQDPLTLLVGGSSKGADYASLVEEIKHSSASNIICIGQEGEKISNLLYGSGKKVFRGGKTMSEIVNLAKSISQPGSVVLLSPAAASFDMFKNASDRGDQYKAAVLLT